VKILVVEDSATQAAHLKFQLKQRNYDVEIASNAQEALIAVSKSKPSIILSDVTMPGIDGYDLCRLLKANPDYQNIPVLLITGLSNPEDVVRGLSAGADCYITKPYTPEELMSRLQFVLDNVGENQGPDVGPLVCQFQGRHHEINASRSQMLRLLLSTYESASVQCQRLQKDALTLKMQVRELEEELEGNELLEELTRRNQALENELILLEEALHEETLRNANEKEPVKTSQKTLELHDVKSQIEELRQLYEADCSEFEETLALLREEIARRDNVIQNLEIEQAELTRYIEELNTPAPVTSDNELKKQLQDSQNQTQRLQQQLSRQEWLLSVREEHLRSLEKLHNTPPELLGPIEALQAVSSAQIQIQEIFAGLEVPGDSGQQIESAREFVLKSLAHVQELLTREAAPEEDDPLDESSLSNSLDGGPVRLSLKKRRRRLR
jgi:DNA-binding response OmpR family regulator